MDQRAGGSMTAYLEVIPYLGLGWAVSTLHEGERFGVHSLHPSVQEANERAAELRDLIADTVMDLTGEDLEVILAEVPNAPA